MATNTRAIPERVRTIRLSEPAKWALLGSTCAAGAALLFFVDPTRPGTALPPCPVYALTGTYCPGCGAARALHSLLHGNLAAALGYNPLLVVGLPFVGFVLARYALLWARRTPLPAYFTSLGANAAVMVVLVAYWVLRNVPLYPFTLLAP